MKTSLIITVLNEEQSIRVLLDSIQKQTKKADEIIIVDAGSTDKTQKIIKSHSLQPKLIIKKDLNRSQARNLGINQAKNQIAVVTDAGCTLDKDWLKQITKPFNNKLVKAVAGFYQVEAKTILQKSMAPFIAVMPDQFDPQIYLPSSRSIAFKKATFKKTGEYPENLDYCEDLIFAKNLKANNNVAIKPQAIVYWQMPANLKEYFIKIKNYASGDIQARYWPHLKKHFFLLLRIILIINIPPLFIYYLIWPNLKYYHYINHPLALIYLPIIKLITDLAVLLGILKGVKISI